MRNTLDENKELKSSVERLRGHANRSRYNFFSFMLSLDQTNSADFIVVPEYFVVVITPPIDGCSVTVTGQQGVVNSLSFHAIIILFSNSKINHNEKDGGMYILTECINSEHQE